MDSQQTHEEEEDNDDDDDDDNEEQRQATTYLHVLQEVIIALLHILQGLFFFLRQTPMQHSILLSPCLSGTFAL